MGSGSTTWTGWCSAPTSATCASVGRPPTPGPSATTPAKTSTTGRSSTAAASSTTGSPSTTTSGGGTPTGSGAPAHSAPKIRGCGDGGRGVTGTAASIGSCSSTTG